MKQSGTETIRSGLRAYADRGVFRSFSEKEGREGKIEFRFVWLAEDPFLLVYDPARETLTFKDLLPGVEKASRIDRDFRGYLRERANEALPEHRRIDFGKLKPRCVNRGGRLSIALKIGTGADHAYAINRAVNLVNDVFMGFLFLPENTDYVRENFEITGE